MSLVGRGISQRPASKESSSLQKLDNGDGYYTETTTLQFKTQTPYARYTIRHQSRSITREPAHFRLISRTTVAQLHVGSYFCQHLQEAGFRISEDRLKQLPSATERQDSRDRFKQPQRFPRQIKHYWHFRIKFNLLLGERQSAKSLNSGWRILYTEIGRVFAVPDTKEIRGSTSASFRAKESRYPSRAATHRETSAATHYV